MDQNYPCKVVHRQVFEYYILISASIVSQSRWLSLDNRCDANDLLEFLFYPGVSLIIVVLMRFLAAIIVWTLVIGVIVLSIGASAYCW